MTPIRPGDEFFIHVDDSHKRLYCTRPKISKSGAFQPCDMTPDDVDYEMSFYKDREVLQINGMNQESFEHFVKHYAHSYRYLHFFHCQLIQTRSSFRRSSRGEKSLISWNIRADKLWNMSKNESLNHIRIIDCKKISLSPQLLATSPTLEQVGICGGTFNNFPIENLDIFGQIPNLRSLDLYMMKPLDKRLDFLANARKLEVFNFDAGMLTTEEIAWIVAKYPNLAGSCLGPYEGTIERKVDVRISGYRKPTLNLPEQQTRLEKYIAEFDALVEKFKTQ